jgi:outer membrane putative beta-barrel porin/alpha-amylase
VVAGSGYGFRPSFCFALRPPAGKAPLPKRLRHCFPAADSSLTTPSFTTRAPGIAGGIPATARPTFSHEGGFNFTWGFRHDFDLTLIVPVITNHFDITHTSTSGGTGLGDSLVLVKYRFYRRDSPRGTTQASVTFGPKLPTGRTNLADANGHLLPASLQPGSGSTDLFLAGNWTYTGLFNIKRLVADEDFHSLLRSQGTQATRLGSDLKSHFWLSYRPYESKNVAREWFIGPVLTWLRSQDDRIAGVEKRGSGGDVLLAGMTTYVGVRPGMHVWLGVDWEVARSTSLLFMPVRRHISFGITQQFRLHR